jgi:hypothetical protein
LASRSLNIGKNATPSAPEARVKNIKSGILKAAKYASDVKTLKFALMSFVRKIPKKIPRNDVAASSAAALPRLIRLFAFRKNLFMLRTKS